MGPPGAPLVRNERMHLPGRMRATTLGDLLGTLYRAGSTGTLEIVENQARTHRVHLVRGLVTAVDLDRASASLAEILRREEAADEDTLRRSLLRALSSRRLHGEVLVREFKLSPDVVDRALRQQLHVRLAVLDQIADAQICFRVAVRAPRGALLDAPLAPRDFLHGRKRARERFFEEGAPPSHVSHDVVRTAAWRTLGLTPGSRVDFGYTADGQVVIRPVKPAKKTAKTLGFTSELGVALCFDIHVQNGGIKPEAMDAVRRSGAKKESDVRVAVANAVADFSSPEYKEDVRKRKVAIATGSGVVHGLALKLSDWGIEDVPLD